MGENEIQDVDDHLEPEQGPVGKVGRERIPWGAVLLLIWALLIIIFSVQNVDSATVEFLWWAWEMPIALLVMVTALVTLVIVQVGLFFYRRKRRRQAIEETPPSDV